MLLIFFLIILYIVLVLYLLPSSLEWRFNLVSLCCTELVAHHVCSPQHCAIGHVNHSNIVRNKSGYYSSRLSPRWFRLRLKSVQYVCCRHSLSSEDIDAPSLSPGAVAERLALPSRHVKVQLRAASFNSHDAQAKAIAKMLILICETEHLISR